jgi:arginine/lysine/ornithine decarboxylase
MHPIALGADMCCDSAHKTLPALTGAGYLHISKNACPAFLRNARSRLALFASTSPSYLILQSLDLCNKYLAEGYPNELCAFEERFDELKSSVSALGFEVCDTEPLKLVINANASGYTGIELAGHLRSQNIEAEFCDDKYLVLMATPQNTEGDLEKLISALSVIEHSAPISKEIPPYSASEQVISIREAMLSPAETVSLCESVGRICGTPTVSCPPAVPIVISGEKITEQDIEFFQLYGIESVAVTKESF